MTLRKLRYIPERGVPPPRVQTPKCEEVVQANQSDFERDWRTRRYGAKRDPFVCTRDAVVEMDGVCLCRLHAGHRALEKWLKGELAEVEK